MARKRSTFTDVELSIDGFVIPLRIYREWRTSIRIAVGKNHVILRIPILYTSVQEQKEIEKSKQWLRKKVLVLPRYQHRFGPKSYDENYSFSILDNSYSLNFESTQNKNHSAKLVDQEVRIKLARDSTIKNSQDAIRTLCSRVIAKKYLPSVTERVHALNDALYQKSIKDVRLKYNKSNWGSCSSSGNVNLSTRLLLAPKDVQDYVIVHELTHLIHMNHSPAFWKLVERSMPNYKDKEAWLREYGHTCDF